MLYNKNSPSSCICFLADQWQVDFPEDTSWKSKNVQVQAVKQTVTHKHRRRRLVVAVEEVSNHPRLVMAGLLGLDDGAGPSSCVARRSMYLLDQIVDIACKVLILSQCLFSYISLLA